MFLGKKTLFLAEICSLIFVRYNHVDSTLLVESQDCQRRECGEIVRIPLSVGWSSDIIKHKLSGNVPHSDKMILAPGDTGNT